MSGFGSENGKVYNFSANGIASIAQVGSKNQAQPTRPIARICDLTSFDSHNPPQKCLRPQTGFHLQSGTTKLAPGPRLLHNTVCKTEKPRFVVGMVVACLSCCLPN